MKKISIAVVAALSLAPLGCKKTGGGADIVAKMTEFKNRMCACKSKACTDKVTDDMTRWNQELAKAGGDKPPTASDDDAKKVMAASDEMTRCLQNIATDAAGGGAAGAGAAGAGAAAGSAAGSGSAAAGGGSAAPAAGGSAASGW